MSAPIVVERLVLGELGTNCWLTSDGSGGPLVVIDPGGDADVLLDAVAGRPVEIVVLTHGHFDHLGAATAICDASGAPLAVHRLDAPVVTDADANGGAVFGFHNVGPTPRRILEDGDVVSAGDLALRVLHTPGHTPGGICLYAAASADGAGAPHLFAGDTLFAGSVGRTDFPGGDARVLARSIADKLAGLPGETLVHPGHGLDTSIGWESRTNVFWPRSR